MNMKKKIRKAFDSATPNVLGSILDDCPAPEKKAPIPVTPEKKGPPHWVKELIATAAAFALLIAVAGGAYLYIRSLTPGTGNSQGETGTESQYQSDSTEPILEIHLEQYLAEQVRAMVCPEGTATNYEGFDLEVETELLNINYYLITAHYKGYTYEFFYSTDGKLAQLSVPLCDCVKDGYISELVAQEIVRLSFVNNPAIDAVLDLDDIGVYGCELVDIEGVPCYRISANLLAMSSTRIFFVNARTGELLADEDVITPPDGNIGREKAMEVALESVDLHKDAVTNLNCVSGYTKEGNLCYVVTFVHGNTLYEIGVGAYNPSVVYSNTSILEPITELEARDIALKYLFVDLENVWSLDISKSDDGSYSVSFCVDGLSGVVSLDRYGFVQSALRGDPTVPTPGVEDHLIGWQVARDIALALQETDLSEVLSLSCEFVSKENTKDHYVITINGDMILMIEARSGWLYYEGDGDGSPSYDTAIICHSDALAIALRDIGGEVVEKWIAGAYDEAASECVLRYVGGDPGRNQIELEYTVTIWIEDYTYVYVLDAYTGAIQEKTVGTFKDDTENPADAAIAAALTHMGHDPDSATVISCDPGKYGGTDCYTVRFFAAGCYYEVVVDAATGQLLDHTGEDQYDALEEFNTLFGNYNSYYNWALNSYYDDPTKVDLGKLFHNANSDGYDQPDVDWYDAWYQSLPEYEHGLDHNFIAGALIEDVLAEYFAVSPEDMSESSFAGLTKIEQIGWYSIVTSDVEVTEDFRAVGYETLGSGDIALYYTSNNYPLCVVTLRLSRNSQVPYQIVSNLPCY